MDRKEIGESLRRKRKALGMSQSDAAYKCGVSDYVVAKIEKGEKVSDESLGKVLIPMGMTKHLAGFRKESKVVNYTTLSLEELKISMTICKDMLRNTSDADLKVEMAEYAKIAEREVLKRLREYFKEETV